MNSYLWINKTLDVKVKNVVKTKNEDFKLDYTVRLHEMSNIVKTLKKHLESTKLIEKQDAAFQHILQERNFFRANSLALAEENEELKKKLNQSRFKLKNLEIDNGNYRTFLFKNREIEAKNEMARQKHTFRVLSELAKDKNTEEKEEKESMEDFEEKSIEYKQSQRNQFSAKRMFKANWQVFKNKNVFVGNIYNTMKKTNYSSYSRIKFKKIGDDNYKGLDPFEIKKNKFRLKSCCTSKKGLIKQNVKRKEKKMFGKESFKLNKDYTLSFLLRE